MHEYLTEGGHSPFAAWHASLDALAALRVEEALRRMERGSLGDHRAVGGAVFERRIHAGPGYRLYFGREGRRLIILLGGGTKRRQRGDIRHAVRLWWEYRRRSEGGR